MIIGEKIGSRATCTFLQKKKKKKTHLHIKRKVGRGLFDFGKFFFSDKLFFGKSFYSEMYRTLHIDAVEAR